MIRSATALLVVCFAASSAVAQSFVNWEHPHVHPLDLTPDGNRLCAVNTADNRLEVFDSSGASLVPLFSVKVGLDPVSVRARTNDEVWVVNHVSDSVSLVSLTTMNVVATLRTEDEPCDVVFAGMPQRAFVSCSQANLVQVFDPANLTASPTNVAIDAEDPRALATSLDGTQVYVAIFESGNASTILGGGSTMGAGGFPPNVVDAPSGPYAGVNPPPNDGVGFTPAQNGANPSPPRVGMIVKKDANGDWMDDNGGNWTSLVSGPSAALSGRPIGWDVLDRDVAIVDASTLGVTYSTGLMNINMALAVHPTSGNVTVVGTDATNEVRFEPVLKGTFVRVHFAATDSAGATQVIADLNGHLDYQTSTIPQPMRDLSLGDPRGIAWEADGSAGWVTGMGSDNVVIVDGSGTRSGASSTIEVGEGPTGIVVHDSASRVYVLNKFEGSISVLDTTSETEVARIPFFDPTPLAVKAGRKHLYSTHENSGLGQVACASCHVDARTDRLSWDLGDPGGDMRAFNQNCFDSGCQDWHPMKGPMLTQTMQDIIGKEPLHWRGDRDGIEEFNDAFIGLQGDDAHLSPTQMQEFEDFLASIHFPPNPFRNFDNTLPTNLALPGQFTSGEFGPAGQPLPDGDATSGLSLYLAPNLLDAGILDCSTCHTLPTGLGSDHQVVGLSLQPIPPGPNGEEHLALVSIDGSTNVSMKVPHLRNLYDRVGMEMTQTTSRSGFGFLHDGSVDSLARFLSEPVFDFGSDQEIADMVAFMMAFSGSDLPSGSATNFTHPPGVESRDTHAAVGKQQTLIDVQNPAPGQLAEISDMEALADACAVGLVVHGRQNGIARGYAYLGAGSYQSDRAAEAPVSALLFASSAPGSELTWTVVPKGSELRIGIDRDEDGFFDRDELDAGSNPADPASLPGAFASACTGDGGDQAGCTDCPCGNNAAPGTGGGCLNSAGTSTRLIGSGSSSVAMADLRFEAQGAPPSNSAVLISGNAIAPANAANPCFGLDSGVTSIALDGLRCAVQGVLRHGVRPSDSNGDIGVTTNGWGTPNGFFNFAAFAAGNTKHFQIVHRDDSSAVCTTGQNTSQAVTVEFQP